MTTRAREFRTLALYLLFAAAVVGGLYDFACWSVVK